MTNEQKARQCVTDDTFVIGYKNDRIAFIRTFLYSVEKEEAQASLNHVQNEELFTGWQIGHVGGWIMESKTNEGARHSISVPLP